MPSSTIPAVFSKTRYRINYKATSFVKTKNFPWIIWTICIVLILACGSSLHILLQNSNWEPRLKKVWRVSSDATKSLWIPADVQSSSEMYDKNSILRVLDMGLILEHTEAGRSLLLKLSKNLALFASLIKWQNGTEDNKIQGLWKGSRAPFTFMTWDLQMRVGSATITILYTQRCFWHRSSSRWL